MPVKSPTSTKQTGGRSGTGVQGGGSERLPVASTTMVVALGGRHVDLLDDRRPVGGGGERLHHAGGAEDRDAAEMPSRPLVVLAAMAWPPGTENVTTTGRSVTSASAAGSSAGGRG